MAVAILALAEGVLRLLGLPPREAPARFINEEAARAHAGIDYVADPGLFWRLPASRSIVGGAYRTNALGLRGPEVTLTKAPRTTRIALVGDSCAFGLGLDEPDTVGALLESLPGPDGTRVEVVPVAVPGYSSQQSLILARRLLARLHADATVLWIGAFNDAAAACGASDARLAEATRVPALSFMRRLALVSALGRLARGAPPPCPPDDADPPPRVSLTEMRANLDALVRLAGRGGKRVVTLVPPVVAGARAEPYARAIGRRRAAIDPSVGPDGFQTDRIHPNRTGAVIVARAIASALGLDGALDPHRADDAARADRAEAALARGAAAAALPDLAALAARSGDRPRLLAAHVTALEALGRWDEALAAVGRALAAHPAVTELRRLRAEALAATGDEAGAIAELRRALARDRGWLAGRIALARILLERGDREGARAQIEVGLELAPDGPELLRLSNRLEP